MHVLARARLLTDVRPDQLIVASICAREHDVQAYETHAALPDLQSMRSRERVAATPARRSTFSSFNPRARERAA